MALDVAAIRPTAVAGTFYPADAGQLTRMVDEALEKATPFDGAPKAVIAPHAGFVYSGAIAGSAYASLKSRRETIKRVVLLGPCHRVAVRNFAVPSHEAFGSPLGPVPLDRKMIDRLLLRFDWVEENDDAHRQEHCLETQLPFLQRLLGDFRLVPVLVGGAPAAMTDQLLAELWGGDETLVVISSDLSHYNDYDTAGRMDLAACQAIEALEPKKLGQDQACGRHAIYGLLSRARALDLRATTLDLRNSGDTAGRNRRDRVVGYAAVAFEEAATAELSAIHRQKLLEAAAKTVAGGVKRGKPPQVSIESYPWPLRAIRASFVTLKLGEQLRGCVGSVVPHQPIVSDVVSSAYKAAFGDKRFPPLEAKELTKDARCTISVSILSHPRPMAFGTEAEAEAALRPGEDGVILREKRDDGEKRGLFLPQVWEGVGGDRRRFLKQLKLKAGLPEDHWSETLRLLRFRTETFGAGLRLDAPAA